MRSYAQPKWNGEQAENGGRENQPDGGGAVGFVEACEDDWHHRAWHRGLDDEDSF